MERSTTADQLTDHEAIAAQNPPMHGETGGEATDLKTPVGESAQQPSPITDVQDTPGGTAAVGHAGKRRPSLPAQTGMYGSHDDAMGRPKRARRPPAHLADFVCSLTCAVAVEGDTSSEPPVFYSEINKLKVGVESNVTVNENERTVDSIPSDCCAAVYCAATNCVPLFDSRSDEMDPGGRVVFRDVAACTTQNAASVATTYCSIVTSTVVDRRRSTSTTTPSTSVYDYVYAGDTVKLTVTTRTTATAQVAGLPHQSVLQRWYIRLLLLYSLLKLWEAPE